MRSRAKCKLCNSIIESFHSTDYIPCKCGEIAVDGGGALKCFAKDFSNFLRVDDEGNIIVVSLKEIPPTLEVIPNTKPSRDELIDMLDEMVKNIERLPSNAMSAPVSHYDLCSALILLSSIFRSERN